jgi:large subunit ribosomal protein L1
MYKSRMYFYLYFQLEKGIFNFEKLFSTNDSLGKIKHLGKALGPKGLMPNAKVGTLAKF